ncbi:MAG: GAF domain-containing protein, partial [Chloroflexota bacterium]
VNRVQALLDSRSDTQSIYDLVGDKVREIFDAQTVVLTIYDRQTNLTHFPYIIENGKRLRQTPMPLEEGGGGFSGHVIRTRKPLVVNRNFEEEAVKYRSYNLGDDSGDDTVVRSGVWVPLIVGEEVKGVLSLQNLEHEDAFSNSDVRLLITLANSMSAALENARLFNETQRLLQETEQRASELTIINRVLAGLDSRGEIQAMYDLVGNKINEIFATHTTVLMIYDRKSNQLLFPYIMERGVRLRQDPIPFPETGGGFSAHVIRTGQPIMVNEDFAQEARKVQSVLMGDNREENIQVKSGLWVPLMVGDEARGVITLQNLEREHAFKESDVRLLSTLANSLGITLESARLFDETERLLKETEERNAELAVINSVQQSLAVQLDMQGIYEAVGDKIREVFRQADVGIRIYDAKSNLTYYPYMFENGRKINVEPSPHSGRGFEGYVFRTRGVILINGNMKEEMEKYDSYFIPGTEQEALPKSLLMAPLIYGDQVRGLISLSDNFRENAYSDSDVRLIQTLANSMGAALENARLFGETQRLLKETEQRASELAIINSVQKSLVSKLDLQAIVELVGEKIWQIFDSQVVVISLYSARDQTIDHRYILERGERIHLEHPLPVDPMRAHVIKMRQTWLINENFRQAAEELGTSYKLAGEEPKSLLFVPLIVGQEVTGVISLQNLDHEHAFAASEVRLLQTIANGMSVAIENARLFDETQRLFLAERQAHEQAETLRSIAHALNASLSLSEVFNLVLTEIQKVIPYDSAAIFEVQNNRRSFVAGRGFDNLDQLIGLSFEFNPQDDEIGYRISRALQPLILDDAMEAYPQYFAVGPHARAEIRSYMGVPIIFNNR